MTKEQLFEAIGGLDEALLDENVGKVQKKHYFGWITAAAACIAVCVGAFFLPKLLSNEDLLRPNSTIDIGMETTETAEDLLAYVEGIHYYPLPIGSSADTVCTEGTAGWYFSFNENYSTYQVWKTNESDPTETGSYVREADIITATSEDGAVHKLRRVDDHAMELLESAEYEQYIGRYFTSRFDRSYPFSSLDAQSIQSVSGNVNDLYEFSLTEAEIAELVTCLQPIVLYDEVKMEMPSLTGGFYVQFTILKTDGTAETFSYYYWFRMEDSYYLYERSTCEEMIAFFTGIEARERRKAEEAQQQTAKEKTQELFGDLLPENIESVAVDSPHTMEVKLGAAEITLFAAQMQAQELEYLILADADSMNASEIVFRVTKKDGTEMKLQLHDAFLSVDGDQYYAERTAAESLYTFGLHILENASGDRTQGVFGALTDIESVTVGDYHSGDSRALSGSETAAFLTYLKAIDINEEDTSDDMIFGGGLYFTIAYADGSQCILSPLGNLITVDGTRYHTEYGPCEVLSEFGYGLLEDGRAERVLPTKDQLYYLCMNSMEFLDQMSGTVKTEYGENSASYIVGSFAFDFEKHQYTSQVDYYDADNPDVLIQSNRYFKDGRNYIEIFDYESGGTEDKYKIGSNGNVLNPEDFANAYPDADETIDVDAVKCLDDPTLAHELAVCFAPQEMTYGYLSDFSKWEITGWASIHDRDCVIVEGDAGTYGAQLGVETFEIWVDAQTGVWLNYQGKKATDTQNEYLVHSYVFTEDIRFGDEAEKPEWITDEELAKVEAEMKPSGVFSTRCGLDQIVTG